MTTVKKGKRLYRILDFARAVQIFENKELYFARPSSWDDPYEKILNHYKKDSIFSQCWSLSDVSDAMWRIYSQNGMGVRISTTAGKLDEVLKVSAKNMEVSPWEVKYNYRLEKVNYMSPVEVRDEASKIADEMLDFFDIGRAVDMLYIKRLAFEHENELRATLYFPCDKTLSGKGVTVPINPHEFIDRILLDPRAPDEVIKAFKYYFKKVLGFKGKVGRSALYRIPKSIEIMTKEISVNDI